MLEQNRKEMFGNALLLCIVCFLLFLTGCGCSRSEESNPAPNSGMMESESASETKNGKIDTTLPVDESERETNNSSETIQLEVEERERLGQYWVDINLPDDMEMEWEIQNLYYDIFIKKTDEEYVQLTRNTIYEEYDMLKTAKDYNDWHLSMCSGKYAGYIDYKYNDQGVSLYYVELREADPSYNDGNPHWLYSMQYKALYGKSGKEDIISVTFPKNWDEETVLRWLTYIDIEYIED